MDLIPKIQVLWKSQKEEIEKTADNIIETFRSSSQTRNKSPLSEKIFEQAYLEHSSSFDKINGGFSHAPKFPTPHKFMFLLRYWKRSGNQQALHMVEKTLNAMHQGGIFDQIGFGFHRYSTDPFWKLPHFEKMLYDQALLTYASSEAFQALKKDTFKIMAEQTIDYVQRELLSPEGAFYSAEDADSEGEEGKYYLWTESEIRNRLLKDEAELILSVYGIEKGGNFFDEATGRKTGKNLFYRTHSWEQTAAELGIQKSILTKKIESIRKKLLEIRSLRPKPLRDDKILTDWNGLMIAALGKASQAFENPAYANAAQQAADFILNKMITADGGLFHCYCKEESSLEGYADDYAFFIWGLLELYEAAFDPIYLRKALDLNTYFIEHFWDPEEGGFFFSGDRSESLFVRKKELYEGAVPSGNSVQTLNLLRLSRISGSVELENMASQMINIFSGEVTKHPLAYSCFLCAVDFAKGPIHEIVIVGKNNDPETKKMLNTVQNNFIPNKVFLYIPSEKKDSDINRIAPYTDNYTLMDDRATIYLCQDYSCQKPSHDAKKIINDLTGIKS